MTAHSTWPPASLAVPVIATVFCSGVGSAPSVTAVGAVLSMRREVTAVETVDSATPSVATARRSWTPSATDVVSNAVGLVYVGALFRDDAAGARWLARGARLLPCEIEYQLSDDGVSYDA